MQSSFAGAPARLAWMGFIGALSVQACTVDGRKLSGRKDNSESDGRADASTPGHGVRIIDSGQIDYTREAAAPDSGPPPPVDTGPCPHVDLQGLPDCDKTLATNADFNRDTSGWKAENGGLLRWIDLDTQGAKNSGALAVKNAQRGDVDGKVGVAASQCLPVTEGKTYAYSASMFIKRGQAYGQGQILAFFYTEDGCEGLVQSAYAVTGVESTEKWMLATGINLTVPATVKSMGVRLQVEKPFRSDTLEVVFDAVRITMLP